jgi:hypothetical protein
MLLLPHRGSNPSERKPRPTRTRSVCRVSGFVLTAYPDSTFSNSGLGVALRTPKNSTSEYPTGIYPKDPLKPDCCQRFLLLQDSDATCKTGARPTGSGIVRPAPPRKRAP